MLVGKQRNLESLRNVTVEICYKHLNIELWPQRKMIKARETSLHYETMKVSGIA